MKFGKKANAVNKNLEFGQAVIGKYQGTLIQKTLVEETGEEKSMEYLILAECDESQKFLENIQLPMGSTLKASILSANVKNGEFIKIEKIKNESPNGKTYTSYDIFKAE